LADGRIAPGTASYRRVNIALFLGGFATFSLLYCTQPLLPVIAVAFHVSPAASSLALSLTTAMLAPAIFLAGALCESTGRRALMVFSLLAASLCNLAAGAATGWYGLLACRALEGVALGGVPAVAMTYLAEEIDAGSLGHAMGLYVGGSALGGMSGRTIAGLLSGAFGWHAALFAIGGLSLAVSLAFSMLLPREKHFSPRKGLSAQQHGSAWLGHILHGGLPFLFAIGGLALGSFVTVYNYVSFRLSDAPYHLSQSQTGLIFLVYIVGVGSSLMAGKWSDRLGRPLALLGSIAVSLLGLALTLAPPLAAIIAGIALLTGGFFATQSVASAWVGRMAKDAKGHAASLYLLFYYLGSSVMGSAGGWVWSRHGWPGIATFAGCALCLAAFLATRLRTFD
jgi:YNFM family putative membrane transporter